MALMDADNGEIQLAPVSLTGAAIAEMIAQTHMAEAPKMPAASRAPPDALDSSELWGSAGGRGPGCASCGSLFSRLSPAIKCEQCTRHLCYNCATETVRLPHSNRDAQVRYCAPAVLRATFCPVLTQRNFLQRPSDQRPRLSPGGGLPGRRRRGG